MNSPNDINIPFFSYGIFQPGSIGHSRIEKYIKKVTPNCKIAGELRIRDGLPILNPNNKYTQVEGCLIEFNPDDIMSAYESINAIEPNNQYRWGETVVEVDNININTNVLFGKKPNKGSEPYHNIHWHGKDDSLFTTAIELINKIIHERHEDESHTERFFRLQMAYLFLWSIIERYVSLRYYLKGKHIRKNKILKLAEEPQFCESLKRIVTEKRTVQRADDPDKHDRLVPLDPKKSIDYYYQIRSNIMHRGKGIHQDIRRVESSLKEMLEIFTEVLKSIGVRLPTY